MALDLYPERIGRDSLELDLIGSREARAIRLVIAKADGKLVMRTASGEPLSLSERRWVRVRIAFDCAEGTFRVSVDGVQGGRPRGYSLNPHQSFVAWRYGPVPTG